MFDNTGIDVATETAQLGETRILLSKRTIFTRRGTYSRWANRTMIEGRLRNRYRLRPRDRANDQDGVPASSCRCQLRRLGSRSRKINHSHFRVPKYHFGVSSLTLRSYSVSSNTSRPKPIEATGHRGQDVSRRMVITNTPHRHCSKTPFRPNDNTSSLVLYVVSIVVNHIAEEAPIPDRGAHDRTAVPTPVCSSMSSSTLSMSIRIRPIRITFTPDANTPIGCFSNEM